MASRLFLFRSQFIPRGNTFLFCAHQSLRRWLDAPQPELEKLIRYIAQNNGRLSKNKRGQFPLITDDDIARAETQVSEAFASDWERSRSQKAKDTSSHTS